MLARENNCHLTTHCISSTNSLRIYAVAFSSKKGILRPTFSLTCYDNYNWSQRMRIPRGSNSALTGRKQKNRHGRASGTRHRSPAALAGVPGGAAPVRESDETNESARNVGGAVPSEPRGSPGRGSGDHLPVGFCRGESPHRRRGGGGGRSETASVPR